MKQHTKDIVTDIKNSDKKFKHDNISTKTCPDCGKPMLEVNGKSKYVFVPHITIAQKLSDIEHDDILGQLRMVGVDEKDSIDRIHLLYQLEDGSWTTYDTYKLTGAE